MNVAYVFTQGGEDSKEMPVGKNIENQITVEKKRESIEIPPAVVEEEIIEDVIVPGESLTQEFEEENRSVSDIGTSERELAAIGTNSGGNVWVFFAASMGISIIAGAGYLFVRS